MKLYFCPHCKNLELVMHDGGPVPVCCGEKMIALEPNTVDAAIEKHLPVVEKTTDGIKITVGSVAHPMEEAHFIEWIAVTDGKTTEIKYLKPGDQPEMLAHFTADAKLSAYAYCNLHGLWLTEV